MSDNLEILAYKKDLKPICRYLDRQGLNVVMIDGPRGSGKTTLVEQLCKRNGYVYYKTWGYAQREVKFDPMGRTDTGLELPQATFFVLDFLSQVDPKQTVIADRCNLSAIVYQRSKYDNLHLQKYYVDLMRSSKACILYITATPREITSRRILRKNEDELRIHEKGYKEAFDQVLEDCTSYSYAYNLMQKAGLVVASRFKLVTGTVLLLSPKDPQ
ncbi:MAG: AAA family ATPase [Gammaproteobacteria bacterium]|nr:AAA family ATPase [Gammaproteobacteria bacterium]